MNRREFIKETIKYCIASGITLSGIDKLFAEIVKLKENKNILVAVKGKSPDKMFESGIAAIGGITKFVKKGQTVLIKPNIGWDVPPELAANTNPLLVGAIVKHCVDAGARKVYVFDHTCDNWERAYKNSGIEYAVKKAGGIMVPGNFKSNYQKVTIPDGKILKSALVHELLLTSDVFINVPVLKSHGSAKLTISMKNLMGVVWDRRYWHITDLNQCIADFSAFRKPDLTVIDAYNVMTKHGPRGTDGSDLIKMKTQIISTDFVAADAAATKIFGINPENIRYIKIADEKGLGSMNLKEINIKKIYL